MSGDADVPSTDTIAKLCGDYIARLAAGTLLPDEFLTAATIIDERIRTLQNGYNALLQDNKILNQNLLDEWRLDWKPSL